MGWAPPLLRLGLDASIMIIVYYAMLLFVMGQSALYLDLIRGLRSSSGLRGMEEAKEGFVS